MSYTEDFNLLNEIYSENTDLISIPGSNLVINNYSFTSDESVYYPDSDYIKNCIMTNISYDTAIKTRSFAEKIHESETYNRKFIFPLYTNPGKSKNLIILLHGLNEGGWEKYHTWAKKLAELTNRSVLMFPVSHHVNRRPPEWIASREMNALAKERQKLFGAEEFSFINSAISTRLHLMPELFFWSGLRSFYDVQKLVKEIRDGRYESIDKDCNISMFGYSIGAFLIEVLLMARKEMFADTKSVLFCGGLTMDMMNLKSRFICDSKAEKSVKNFYTKDYESCIERDVYLKKYFKDNEEEGMAFRSMLNSGRLEDYRYCNLKHYEDRILAIPLKNDEVAPAEHVRKTLTGNGLKVRVEEMHTDIEYDHIMPFSILERLNVRTNEWFERIFSRAAEWLE